MGPAFYSPLEKGFLPRKLYPTDDIEAARPDEKDKCMRAAPFVIAALFTACGPQQTSREMHESALQRALPPGKICTPDDADFDGFRYPAHLAHCRRNVSAALKKQVAEAYGVPARDYHLYEFDHYLPLNAGGANAFDNLWPQLLEEAKQKDVVEEEVYVKLKNGEIDQQEAIAIIKRWRPAPEQFAAGFP